MMRKRMTMWEERCLEQKKRKTARERTQEPGKHQFKGERKEVEKKEAEKEETSEAQKKPLVDKAQRTSLEFLCVGKERRRRKGERHKEEQESQDETSSGKIWKMALPSLDFDAELVLCRCCSREAGAKRESGGAEDRYRVGCGQRHESGLGWQKPPTKKPPRKWKWSKGADWTERGKEEKRLKCTLLNGSAWSTEKKYMRRYEGTFDIFFGIEHRLRKEELEEQLNKETKEGWRLAASAAIITEETAGDEDRKHTSGGVFIAIDSNLGAVVGAEEGATESIPGNEGRIAQAWVNVGGGLRIFSVD